MNLKQNCYIYIENYNDWIEIQKFLFNLNIEWAHTKKQLFKSFTAEEIIFPRYIIIFYDYYPRRFVMLNNANDTGLSMRDEDWPIIIASKLLRKKKLQKLNEI